MPIALFSDARPARLGKVFGEAVIDLSVAAPQLPSNLISFLAEGARALDAYGAVKADGPGRLDLSAVRLHAPIPAPQKFLAIGMNYREHAQEALRAGIPLQEYQLWFNKQVSCINGPFDDVVMPKVSDKLDYEAELVVVIGRDCRHVAASEARAVIGGYMIGNDVSVRDWQRRSQTMTLGKSFDTHGPVGPWLTLDHELSDPLDLPIRMFVNGELRQADHTGEMVHSIYEQIAYLSTVMTLRTGDLISTGTPSGVGVAKTPPQFLKIGDTMRVEIGTLGYIENRVVAEI
ncbi:MAG: fumarylacetoacetate hydrolase family protein [Hyphomonadaceae bacterium]